MSRLTGQFILERSHKVSELHVLERLQNIGCRDALVLLPFRYFMSTRSSLELYDLVDCRTHPAAGAIVELRRFRVIAPMHTYPGS